MTMGTGDPADNDALTHAFGFMDDLQNLNQRDTKRGRQREWAA